MTLTVWRLVKEKHAKNAFVGEGARQFGGRWNARGTPVVYLSSSLSLAALELFLHLTTDDARLRFAAIPVEMPAGLTPATLPRRKLPKAWRSEPPPDACKALGSAWAEAGGTVLLQVPSVIVPHESNYLLNPRHPDFARLKIHRVKPFGFDSRMWN